jgi:hypothetical protein
MQHKDVSASGIARVDDHQPAYTQPLLLRGCTLRL